MKASAIDAFLTDIEFSNNGVLDSLTGAPAPRVFFGNLSRDISQSRRKSQAISIITIKLLQKDTHSKTEVEKTIKETITPENLSLERRGQVNLGTSNKPGLTNKPGVEKLEIERGLVIISNCIRTSMRGTDFYSRMAENGFWLCLQGDLEESLKAAQRFEEKISEKLAGVSNKAQTEFAANEWRNNLDMNNWIHEIDKQYFLKA